MADINMTFELDPIISYGYSINNSHDISIYRVYVSVDLKCGTKTVASGSFNWQDLLKTTTKFREKNKEGKLALIKTYEAMIFDLEQELAKLKK